MLLDTSGLYAFFDEGARQHVDAVRLMAGARQRVTHSYVLSEFVALARSYGHPSEAILRFLIRLDENPLVKVIYVDKRLHRQGVDLLDRRRDRKWSLCDAVSFVVMERCRLWEALTTDHHFEQAGLVRLLQP